MIERKGPPVYKSNTAGNVYSAVIICRFDEGHKELADYLLFDFLDGRNGE